MFEQARGSVRYPQFCDEILRFCGTIKAMAQFSYEDTVPPGEDTGPVPHVPYEGEETFEKKENKEEESPAESEPVAEQPEESDVVFHEPQDSPDSPESESDITEETPESEEQEEESNPEPAESTEQSEPLELESTDLDTPQADGPEEEPEATIITETENPPQTSKPKSLSMVLLGAVMLFVAVGIIGVMFALGKFEADTVGVKSLTISPDEQAGIRVMVALEGTAPVVARYLPLADAQANRNTWKNSTQMTGDTNYSFLIQDVQPETEYVVILSVLTENGIATSTAPVIVMTNRPRVMAKDDPHPYNETSPARPLSVPEVEPTPTQSEPTEEVSEEKVEEEPIVEEVVQEEPPEPAPEVIEEPQAEPVTTSEDIPLDSDNDGVSDEEEWNALTNPYGAATEYTPQAILMPAGFSLHAVGPVTMTMLPSHAKRNSGEISQAANTVTGATYSSSVCTKQDTVSADIIEYQGACLPGEFSAEVITTPDIGVGVWLVFIEPTEEVKSYNKYQLYIDSGIPTFPLIVEEERSLDRIPNEPYLVQNSEKCGLQIVDFTDTSPAPGAGLVAGDFVTGYDDVDFAAEGGVPSLPQVTSPQARILHTERGDISVTPNYDEDRDLYLMGIVSIPFPDCGE